MTLHWRRVSLVLLPAQRPPTFSEGFRPHGSSFHDCSFFEILPSHCFCSRLAAAFLLACRRRRSRRRARQMWLYYPTNLLVDANVDRLETIFRRAAKAGYSHVLIGDSKFSKLDRMPQRVFSQCRSREADCRLNCICNWCRPCFRSAGRTRCWFTIRIWPRGCRCAINCSSSRMARRGSSPIRR